MQTLSELAIQRARLLRDHRRHPRQAHPGLRLIDRQILDQPAASLDDAVVKLELARELAALEGSRRLVRLIEDALRVLRG